MNVVYFEHLVFEKTDDMNFERLWFVFISVPS